MRRGLIVSICIILTITLCVFFTDTDVKAADGYIKQQYKFFTPSTVSGVSLWQTVPANTSLNQYQLGISDVSARIPSNVWTSGYSISFGIRTPWSTEPTNNAWGTNCTCYFGNPYQYQETDINYYSYSGTSTSYTIKYPCAFINYYPSDVTIPSYYTTLDNSFSRNVVYSKPDYVGNQKCGNILAAVIVPQGKPFLMYSGNTYINENYPMDTQTACSVETYAYYNSLGSSGYIPFYFFSVNDTYSQTGWGNIDAGFCTHTDVPVFCDLYDALYYSVTGVVSDSNKVLYGLETAVQPVTPTPTDNPTPSPTGSPSGTITGTVTVEGGTINIGNFPTAVPTPTPIVPIITDAPPNDGDVSSGNGSVDSNLLNKIVPSITPGAYNFTTDESNALNRGNSLLPHQYLIDIMDTNGSIFSRYPIAAIDRLSDENLSQAPADEVSFFTYLAGTFYVFSDGRDTGGGIFGDLYFWFEAVIVSGILFIIVRKIIH